ncbi:MAG TPA: cytochrome c [Acidobacteriota bacterium]|nr:cytochrome c [Acidobacteriota bacterium]
MSCHFCDSFLKSLLFGGIVLCFTSVVVDGQDARSYFRQNCQSCHTIGGGRLSGPDLKGVTERQDRAWLTDFVVNPKAKIDAGDPYALRLLEEARGVQMPTLPGMTPDLARALLDLIESESRLPKSEFAGLSLPTRPFSDQDRELGRAIFRGSHRLMSGGPSCISCHTVKGISALGGGRLGPDLTLVYERLKGRAGLGAWLSAPATPTMQPLFSQYPLNETELIALLAFFEQTAQVGGEDHSSAPFNFFLLGLGGSLVGLYLFAIIWKKRFRAVRRPLVDGSKIKGVA